MNRERSFVVFFTTFFLVAGFSCEFFSILYHRVLHLVKQLNIEYGMLNFRPHAECIRSYILTASVYVSPYSSAIPCS